MTNALANAMAKESHAKLTENGAYALDSSLDPVLDLFAEIGALRIRLDTAIIDLFEKAYCADKLLATKILFYARDIREGLGERRVFRILLKYCAATHPEAIHNNIKLIGEYGRYDDLYVLIDTKLEDLMWSEMKRQFNEDLENMQNGNPISLLAKWIKTPDASSANTRALGIRTAKKLGYTVYEFKRILRKMRKYLKIVEAKMSTNEWASIDYESVPSRAAMLYTKAFYRHDKERYGKYIEDVKNGDKKINAGALYPYDIIERYNIYDLQDCHRSEPNDVLEELWKALPNYVSDDAGNMLVMADVSGSMGGRPMATSIGLAIYFAERNKGDFHNMFMTFSGDPYVVSIQGDTLYSKIASVFSKGVGFNTDIVAAFRNLLRMAIASRAPAEDMPSVIIIVSDMEFDMIGPNSNKTFYDDMQDEYTTFGYTIPHIVFWNVNARNDTFHATSDIAGVSMVSGSSVTSFKNMVAAIEGTTPLEFMLSVINVERYDAITIVEQSELNDDQKKSLEELDCFYKSRPKSTFVYSDPSGSGKTWQ